MADAPYTAVAVFPAGTFSNGKCTMTCDFAVGGEIVVEVRHSLNPEMWVSDDASYTAVDGSLHILDMPLTVPVRITPTAGTTFNVHGIGG